VGFETYLQVGGQTVVQWRKTTGDLPRLLFARSELKVELSDDGSETEAVAFNSTAGKCLTTLTQQGLGWSASVASYSAVRSGHSSEAVLHGMYWVEACDRLADAALEEHVERRLEAERVTTPEQDLRYFGAIIAAQLVDPESDVLLLGELSWDESLEATSALLFQARDAAVKADQPILPVLRAVETLMILFREARLVAWPILISTLLQQLPSNTPTTYVLSDGIQEFEMTDLAGAEAFIDEWWSSTADGIGEYARNLGVLFSTLSEFQTRLGPPFWFGQAAVELGQMDRLNRDRKSSTNKSRGDVLESLVDVLLKTEPELAVLEKNFSTPEEEIDLLLTNGLSHPFWLAQSSPYILVECKNWRKPVGVKELRVFESKMEDRRGALRIGIFISTSGFAKTFIERLKSIQGRGVGIIYAVSGEDVRQLIATRRTLSDWLRTDGATRAFYV
jgi:hypothetical protein